VSEAASSSYDLVIIGAGVGGYVAAIRAGTWGARVALVEEAELGGTCLNRGCIPTKTFVEEAAAFESARRHGFVSVHAVDKVAAKGWKDYAGKRPGGDAETAPTGLDAMIRRKDEVVAGLRKGVASLLKKRKVEFVEGRARLAGPSGDARTVKVELAGGGERTLHAAHVVLATGSRPAALPFLKPDGARVFTSDEILDAAAPGPRIAIVGGGILGCEFAYVYSALGYEVSVIEMLDRLVPTFSPDASRELGKALKKRRITVHTGTRIEGADVGDVVGLALGEGKTLEADTVLLAVGRRPNSHDIGIEGLAPEGMTDERGFVPADERGRTGAPGLYAVGDLTGKALLAHAASHQGLVAVADALGHPVPSGGAVPSCAYTHPEIASVGTLEAGAAAAGREVITGRFPVMGLGRARAAGESAGYFKIVADAGTHRILGAEIVGPHATDLIHEAALAVRLEATLEDVEEMVHAHPTFSEGLMEAAAAALGRAIHM